MKDDEQNNGSNDPDQVQKPDAERRRLLKKTSKYAVYTAPTMLTLLVQKPGQAQPPSPPD